MPPSPTRALLLATLGLLGPIALLALVAPWLPRIPLLAGALSFLTASSAIVLAVALAPMTLLAGPRTALVTVLAGTLLAALAFALPPVASGLSGSLAVVAVAVVLGAAVGTRMEAPGHLLAVALVSAAIDLWSVTSPVGPTHHIVRNPVLVRLLTVSVAVPPSRAPSPAIGFGDVVFAALYASAGARFGLARTRTLAALVAGLLAAGGAAMLLGVPVPALPALGAAMVLAHPEARRVRPGDRSATWLAAGLLVASVVRVVTRWPHVVALIHSLRA